ncbi:LysR family transcriptional regulator [Streptomyces zagrosensis]|uniref:DNA-binding transcriptional LysR family regulator n=1 Tax=Streptomyces zagrosensis TaxID=1042984 RepID=A0A7W9QGJ2_9ACTN|nr:LysR family transcriptional regulator [Streptomyces zagrosensis]MBB5939866.1 DNA-binding transcriptional LysR family regulator [Streptomyces zagrosensis]
MELEVRHLRAIAAIGTTGSLTLAARQLGMSQPALSKLLQRIERSVGDMLFVRTKNGSIPTPLGADILAEAHSVLRGMTGIRERAQAWGARGGPRDPLKIGGYCGYPQVALARRLRELPWCSEVLLHEDLDAQTAVDGLAVGVTDLAMVSVPPATRLVVPDAVNSVTAQASEPVFIALAPDHPLAEEDSVPLARLAAYPWVDEPPGHTVWTSYVRRVCHQAAVSLGQQHSTVSPFTALELIADQRSIFPTFCTSSDRPGHLVIRALAGDPLRLELRLFYRRNSTVHRHIEEVLQHTQHVYDARLGCSRAYDAWWLGRRHSLAG